MGHQEADIDVPVETEHVEDVDGEAVLVPAKDRVDAAGDEDGGPGVQAVVEQLPQGGGGPSPPGLFTVYT